MDPTKPILDLYGDSFYSIRQKQQRPQNYKSSNVTSYNTMNNPNTASKYRQQQPQNTSTFQKRAPQQQPSYSQLQDKYQQLYQAYKQKSSKLSQLQQDNDCIKSENIKLRSQIDRLIGKNQQLNSAMLSKNLQLEEAYRKLQEQIRNGGRANRNNYPGGEVALDKLQDGLREAINSNYQILRESALAELKQFIAQ